MAENILWTSQAPHAVEHAQHGDADVGEDREPDRGKAEGAEDEDVGILVRAGVTGHFVKESREVTVEAVGEGGHRSRGGGFHHSVSSISSIR